ncbi:tRNA pseudouridine(55) synthase TruB [Patescibacteria group bacterium]|nr:tRNA pseudouridine(55) synthase TruB [Patescibacteria group bacterium]
MSISGFFLIDKPVGPTSHDVVDVLRRVTGERTIGHAGTLDPLASGLLVLAVTREFTKQVDKFKSLDKVYRAEITLGKDSSTYDSEGELTAVSDREPSDSEIKNVLKTFIGQTEQLPPIFSAKKIGGQSAHKLARQGEAVELKPSPVEVYDIELIDYRYPRVEFTTRVSPGTYIRSLAHDIGKELGVGAYLSNLCRVRIGEFSVIQAIKLDEIKSITDLEKARVSDMV